MNMTHLRTLSAGTGGGIGHSAWEAGLALIPALLAELACPTTQTNSRSLGAIKTSGTIRTTGRASR